MASPHPFGNNDGCLDGRAASRDVVPGEFRPVCHSGLGLTLMAVSSLPVSSKELSREGAAVSCRSRRQTDVLDLLGTEEDFRDKLRQSAPYRVTAYPTYASFSPYQQERLAMYRHAHPTCGATVRYAVHVRTHRNHRGASREGSGPSAAGAPSRCWDSSDPSPHISKVEIFALLIHCKSFFSASAPGQSRCAQSSEASSEPQNLTALAPRLWAALLSKSGQVHHLCR